MSSTPTVPGTDQPVSSQGTAQHYSVEQPPAQAPSEPQIPETVQSELSELRAFREQAGPMGDLIGSMGGESLYQHYANYANLLEQQRQQPQPPQQPSQPQRQSDPWDDSPEAQNETLEITKLREDLVAAKNEINSIRNSVGTDKVRSHSQRFFEKEYPDLTPEERETIDKGMQQAIKAYSQSPQGQQFLQNPNYDAVRALALRHLTPQMLEEVHRRRFERERTQRSSLSTDAYRPSQPGTEEVDYGDDFLSAWNASGEAVRREGLM